MQSTSKNINDQLVTIGSACELGVSNQDIAAFYAVQWARPIALGRTDYLQWQFNDAPTSEAGNHSVVALDGTEIIAVMGATPRDFCVGETCKKGAELTTWIVSPKAQGRGVGGKMLRYFQSRYEVLSGAGITNQALPLYLKAEFTFLAHIPRFFYVSDFERIARFTDPHSAALSIVQRRQQMGAALTQQGQACAAFDLPGRVGQPTPDAIQWNRDAAYMQWRYDEHPVFTYEAFAIDANASNACGVVMRQDEVDGIPFLHVVDFSGPPSGYAAAGAFLEAEATRRGCAFVDISATHHSLIANLRARGWNSAVDDPLIELPSLFYPVELRRPPTTSLVFWARDDRSSLYDFGQQFYSKGDLDLDRPTLAFYEKHGL
ncbi:GNAT family N-acetyltransferase [Shimia abyssi]|nr:GNAT family N-acetyltransferase [Shimia abyssi]